LILELQSDRHVFEAMLEAPYQNMPSFETGSLLSVTGVCLLDTAASTAAVQQILLRSSSDVSLLQGPPWWNWRRTAALIAVLIAVLAGSLLRILVMNRRFARQQAARLAFTRGMLESQESERRRIAASLHDSLGQDLLVIRNQTHLAIQSAAIEPALRQRLEEISGTTLQAINEVREITHNLRPYQLDRLGLSQAIRAITRKVSENCPVEFACHVDEIDGVFDHESEIHIYRIVQEGINNVLKHSGATEATVVVKTANGHLSISIRDNGRGFVSNGAETGGGFGLSGIRERAGIMGGSAKIDSSPDQGVNLLVQLPIQNPKT
jgi:signal transduction histidine kinase